MMPSPEQFKQAYSRLPLPIREYLAGDELGIAAEAIGQAHGMHVDTTGLLADVISQTLLGFISPQELPSALMKELSLPEADALSLITDINQKVFIPLQKQVRDAAAKAQEEAEEEEPKERIVPVAARTTPASVTSAPVPQTPNPATPVAPTPIQTPLPATTSTPQAIRLPVQQHSVAPSPQPSASVSAPAAQNIHIYVGPQNHPPQTQPIIQPIMMQPIAAPIHSYPQAPQQPPIPTPVASRPAPVMPQSQPVPPQLPTFHPESRTMASDMQLARDLQEGIVRQTPSRPEPVQTPQVQPQYSQPVQPPSQLPRDASSDPYREPVV